MQIRHTFIQDGTPAPSVHTLTLLGEDPEIIQCMMNTFYYQRYTIPEHVASDPGDEAVFHNYVFVASNKYTFPLLRRISAREFMAIMPQSWMPHAAEILDAIYSME